MSDLPSSPLQETQKQSVLQVYEHHVAGQKTGKKDGSEKEGDPTGDLKGPLYTTEILSVTQHESGGDGHRCDNRAHNRYHWQDRIHDPRKDLEHNIHLLFIGLKQHSIS